MLATALAAVFAASPVDPQNLLETFGVLGLFGIVFAETGLMVGFFLPGDSLLVLAGLTAAVGSESKLNLDINLGVVLVGLFIAAVVGAQTGYFIGLKAGPALFRRPDSRLFKREYVDKAQHYFDRYGPKTIVLARFVPIVRTFANPIAGVAKMPVREFTIFNIVGGALWTVSVTMLGYVLGKTIPSAEDHLILIEAIIIVLSLVPVAVEVVRTRRERAKSAADTEPATDVSA
jgi:membrane-associated protein